MKQTATMRRLTALVGVALVAVLGFSGAALAATTPLAVTKTLPPSGATEVSRTANVKAYFNHDMKASTITSSTFKIRKQGSTTWTGATPSVNNSISPTSANGGSQSVATLNPNVDLAANTTYQVVVVGRSSGVKDLNGSALSANKSWTFTTVTPPETTIDPLTGPTGTVSSDSASFSFSSSKPNSAFKCSLDGSTFAACTSPKNYPGPLNEGEHVFRVRAIDASGIQDSTPAIRRWKVDTLGPDATITSGPSSPSNSLTASFSFSGAEPGGGYECKIDAFGSPGAFSACSSGQSFTVESDGPYTFSVRASDALGNFGSSDSHTWTVDTAAPTVDGISPANGATGVAPTASVTTTFSEAMNASTVSGQTFTLSNEGSPVSAQVTYDQNSRTATLDPAGDLQTGATYDARIATSVKDQAGNALAQEKAWSFTVEAPPPVAIAPNPLDFGSACQTTITKSVNITNNTASQVDLFPNVTTLAFSVAGDELHIASGQSVDLPISWRAGNAHKQPNADRLELKNSSGDVVATSDLNGFVFCPFTG